MNCEAIKCGAYNAYVLHFPMVVGKPEIVLCKDHFQELKIHWRTYPDFKEFEISQGFREKQAQLAINDIKDLYSKIQSMGRDIEFMRSKMDSMKDKIDTLEGSLWKIR